MSGLGSGLFSALMGAFAKHGTESFSGADLLVFRMFWSTILLLPFCWRRVHSAFKKDAKLMWVRALFGSLGALCYFHSLKLTSLSMALLLWSISPVFVLIMAFSFFGERFNIRQLCGALAICLGILFIRLGAIEYMAPKVVAIGLAGAFFAACAYLSLKRVPKQFDPILVVFMLSILSFFVSVLFSSRPLAVICAVDRIDLWGVTISNLGMQTLMTIAYRKMDASIAVLLTQSSLIWAAGLDYWLFSTPLSPLKISMFMLIIFGLILIQKKLPKFGKETPVHDC